jgi:hypothetical protein
MRQNTGHVDSSPVLASSTGPGVLASGAATADPADGAVALPRLSSLRLPRRARWP